MAVVYGKSFRAALFVLSKSHMKCTQNLLGVEDCTRKVAVKQMPTGRAAVKWIEQTQNVH